MKCSSISCRCSSPRRGQFGCVAAPGHSMRTPAHRSGAAQGPGGRPWRTVALLSPRSCTVMLRLSRRVLMDSALNMSRVACPTSQPCLQIAPHKHRARRSGGRRRTGQAGRHSSGFAGWHSPQRSAHCVFAHSGSSGNYPQPAASHYIIEYPARNCHWPIRAVLFKNRCPGCRIAT